MKIAKEYAEDFKLQEQTDFAVSSITEICDKIGPRRPGSPEELKAAILAGVNETMRPFGINDGTVMAIKDTKTGEVLA